MDTGNRKKILLVEDSKFMSAVGKNKLTKSGFDVATAMNGEEAIKILETDKPDLILLDLIMPKKDGFQVLEEINKNPNWKKIPIIVSSTLEQKEDMDRVKQFGVVDYVIKSDISTEELVARINKALSS